MKHLGMSADELKPYNIPREKPAKIPRQVILNNNIFLNKIKYKLY